MRGSIVVALVFGFAASTIASDGEYVAEIKYVSTDDHGKVLHKFETAVAGKAGEPAVADVMVKPNHRLKVKLEEIPDTDSNQIMASLEVYERSHDRSERRVASPRLATVMNRPAVLEIGSTSTGAGLRFSVLVKPRLAADSVTR
jgi:hypothetical protein